MSNFESNSPQRLVADQRFTLKVGDITITDVIAPDIYAAKAYVAEQMKVPHDAVSVVLIEQITS